MIRFLVRLGITFMSVWAPFSFGAVSKPVGRLSSEALFEPKGFVLMPAQEFVDLSRAPLAYFSDARLEFAAHNIPETISDLKAADHVFKIGVLHMHGIYGAGDLERVERQTAALVTRVRQGSIRSPGAFDRKIGQILFEKAQSDGHFAASRWATSQDYRRVGYDLKLATDELDLAATWKHKGIDKTAFATLADVRRVSQELIEGAPWTAAQVSAEISDFNLASRTMHHP